MLEEVKDLVATTRLIPFEVPGADGGPVRGDIRTAGTGEGRPAVVVCHGFKGFKDWGFFPHVAARVAKAGMTAVTFNFSGSGVGADGHTFSEPDRFRRATVSNHVADLRTVWRALWAGRLAAGIAPPTAAGVMGHSLGGGVAILHAAAAPDCAALVTWAAVSTFLRWDAGTVERWRDEGTLDVVNTRTGEILPLATDYLRDLEEDRERRLDLARAAGDITVPWLLLHGGEDETVSTDEAERHRSAARRRAPDVAIIPAAGHTFGARHPWSGSTPELEDVMERSVEWFGRYLL